MFYRRNRPSASGLDPEAVHNAHFVDVAVPSLIGAAQPVNFIAESDGGFTYLYLVPPLLLVVPGVAIARAPRARRSRSTARGPARSPSRATSRSR